MWIQEVKNAENVKKKLINFFFFFRFNSSNHILKKLKIKSYISKLPLYEFFLTFEPFRQLFTTPRIIFFVYLFSTNSTTFKNYSL